MVTLNHPAQGNTNWYSMVDQNWTTIEGNLGVGDIGCRVYNSAAISVASLTLQTLTLDSSHWDTDSMHSTVTNTSRITFKHAGKYFVGGGISYSANAGGTFRGALIGLNGGITYLCRTIAPVFGGTDGVPLNLNCVYNFAVNDYIELIAYHDAGVAINVASAFPWTPEFWAQKMA